ERPYFEAAFPQKVGQIAFIFAPSNSDVRRQAEGAPSIEFRHLPCNLMNTLPLSFQVRLNGLECSCPSVEWRIEELVENKPSAAQHNGQKDAAGQESLPRCHCRRPPKSSKPKPFRCRPLPPARSFTVSVSGKRRTYSEGGRFSISS